MVHYRPLKNYVNNFIPGQARFFNRLARSCIPSSRLTSVLCRLSVAATPRPLLRLYPPPLSPLSAKLAILTPGCRALFGHPVRVGSGQDDHLQTRDRMSRMRLPLRHPFGSLSMKWRGENRINSLSRKPSPFQGGSSLYFHVRCCMRDILSLRAHGVPVRSYMAWGGVNCIKIPGFIQIFFTGFD